MERHLDPASQLVKDTLRSLGLSVPFFVQIQPLMYGMGDDIWSVTIRAELSPDMVKLIQAKLQVQILCETSGTKVFVRSSR